MDQIGISLQEYLIKYSNIDRRFIRDFIMIQESDEYEEYYPFVIDLEIVLKWLKIEKKDHLKDTLIKSYKKDVNYILVPVNRDQDWGGHNYELILLTVACFKKIAIRSKSVTGEKVVDYYLALERLIVEYQKYVISVLISENKLLKNDLNNEIFPEGGLVYIIDLGNGYFKLGYTMDLKERKKIYDTGTVHKNKVVFWFETSNMKDVEKCVKLLLKCCAIKKGKEVFHVPLDLMIKSIKRCNRFLLSSECKICNEDIKPNEMHAHIKKVHADIINQQVKILPKQLRGQVGGKILRKKENKTINVVHDKNNYFSYVVTKGSDISIKDDHRAYQLLMSIGLGDYLPKIFSYTEKDDYYILVTEWIDNKLNRNFERIADPDLWKCLITQLIYFVKKLESHHINHNDFHKGNILLQYDKEKKICQLKVIDFETLSDYKTIFPTMIKDASIDEKTRMGWSDHFHVGSDLNQMLGELIDQFREFIPTNIINEIEPIIIKLDKKFEFAISGSNKKTSGAALSKLKF